MSINGPETKLIVVDDFLPFPDVVREQAILLDYCIEGDFPGRRSFAADGEYQIFIQHRIEPILNKLIEEWTMDSFCFQLCYEGAETWVHKDETEWAGVLYLTPDAPTESGTGFYEEVNPGEFELVDAVANKYNRLILYKGDILHRSLLSGFGNSPDTGRLTQVFFFNTGNKYG